MIEQSKIPNFANTEKPSSGFRTHINLHKIRWFGLILGLIVFFINWIFSVIDFKSYIKFVEFNFSPDGIVSSPEKVIIKVLLRIIMISVILIAITSKSSLESLYKSSIFNRFLYFLVFVLFTSYCLVRVEYPYLYIEDGFFESLTAVFAIMASLLCLISIYFNNDNAFIKYALFVLFFLFGMEEISWGQRIFGWNTPNALSSINYQNETNIHNIFNPYLSLLYSSFNLLFGFLILSSMKLRKKVASWLKIEKYTYFIPSHEFKLYGFIFILLSFQSYFYGGELTEEIFSVFILAYAVNLLSKAITSQREKKESGR
ncbi:MAG: hypothetical protein PHW73_05630 [Atribacterota bacterium]|nr:hypothetical protein [Atribacterota bacterium]